MSANVKLVTFKVLGKDYTVPCPIEEQESLLSSARKLDRQMCEIRDAGKIQGGEKIAVMVALNIMTELQLLQKKQETPEQEFAEKLVGLRQKIEKVLEN
jgi:cell division protein ZapA